jgi:hypothetical protein
VGNTFFDLNIHPLIIFFIKIYKNIDTINFKYWIHLKLS